jgi:hypothetical protein
MPVAAGPLTEVIPIPSDYASLTVPQLLDAAAAGKAAFDQRLLRALLDKPAHMTEIAGWAGAHDFEEDNADISECLMNLFAAYPAAEAMPFLLSEIARYPEDVPEELTLALVGLQEAAVEPMLAYLDETDDADIRSEVRFQLILLGVADPRIEARIAEAGREDPEEERILREVHQGRLMDTAEYKPIDIWEKFPAEAEPCLDNLPDATHLEFLGSLDPRHRRVAAEQLSRSELAGPVLGKVLQCAMEDTDAEVRGWCWAGLCQQPEDLSSAAEKRMASLVRDPATPLPELIGVLNQYLGESNDPTVMRGILACYDYEPTRARAISMMSATGNPAFADYTIRHLDDADFRIRREAALAVGFLQLRSEASRLEPLFIDEDVRKEALMAYAMASPCPTTRFDLRRLVSRIERMAGGFDEEDQLMVEAGVDLRLAKAGKAPMFAGEEDPTGAE